MIHFPHTVGILTTTLHSGSSQRDNALIPLPSRKIGGEWWWMGELGEAGVFHNEKVKGVKLEITKLIYLPRKCPGKRY
ncbi:MAG: hypothetical protein COS08_07840 [Euryarchaeota archaeon CG01_land_8_20_14_3_00_38_12]|nr:MAG: hypothetical protein COS08_07840 [Euryarchaeota archaeon CG01_land_8_20_14_3_00_38_12]PJB21490.1 MAG: hypothetical protein CO114_05090 [Euryarchaeota archaeon CG_4_9_14_3_um_filter_38_12]